jgi:hypothetical protein
MLANTVQTVPSISVGKCHLFRSVSAIYFGSNSAIIMV